MRTSQWFLASAARWGAGGTLGIRSGSGRPAVAAVNGEWPSAYASPRLPRVADLSWLRCEGVACATFARAGEVRVGTTSRVDSR
ncbi:hypothetical protein STRAU_4948 [Streptomyces aurantiacus JA 4570]|uniref:Uncharacterized protein n=1 Tax=Streptomyces aurantiacus JA 4570 TaxID=1286094 RepID=S4AKM3_9ACTN|nr:hypothetical protein STRAU_4948 [Streptomyces aurantiacus JA 4570]